MNPVTGATWGALSKAEVIPHQNTIGTFTGDDYNWADFDALKNLHFALPRRRAFHYAISVHQLGGGPDIAGLSRGVDDGASDFVISQGGVRRRQRHHPRQRRLPGEHLHARTGPQPRPQARRQRPRGIQAELPVDHELHVPGHDAQARRHTGARLLAPPGEPRRACAQRADRFRRSRRGRGLHHGVRLPRRDRPAGRGPGRTDRLGLRHQRHRVGRGRHQRAQRDDTFFLGHTDWDKLVYSGGLVGLKNDTLPSSTVADEQTMAERNAAQAVLDSAPRTFTVPGLAPTPPSDTQPSVGPPSPSAVAVRLSALRLAPRSVRRTARITFSLTRGATVRFTVERAIQGRRSAGRCRATARRGRRCTLFKGVRGSFSHTAVAGANTVRFSRRLGGRNLSRGSYRLVATPEGGSPVRIAFTVTR